LKKNTVDITKVEITKNHIAWKSFNYIGLVKLAQRMFIVPLVKDCENVLLTSNPETIKANIRMPVRSLECRHSEVFDLVDYLNVITETGESECLVCKKPIKLTSLYIETRVYHVLKGFPKAVLAAFPNPDVKGYDADIAYPLTVDDIIKINNEELTATRIMTRKGADGKKVTNVAFNVPSFLLSPLEYSAKEGVAKFTLEVCSKEFDPMLENVNYIII
jgi:hypothetical protein